MLKEMLWSGCSLDAFFEEALDFHVNPLLLSTSILNDNIVVKVHEQP